jgi:tetratricopeptide (TPR) repeat protein
VLRHLATFHLARAEIDKVEAIGRDVLAMAQAEGDIGLQVEGHVMLGPALAFLGDTAAGIAHLDRAIALYDRQQVGTGRLRLGPSPHVVARSVSALFHWLSGNPGEALRRAAMGVEVAVEIDHPYSLAYATFHGALLDLWVGRIAEADARARAVIAMADERDYPVWKAIGIVLQGVTTAIQGQPEDGLAMTLRGIGMYADLQTPPVFWPQLLGLKARVCAIVGRPEEALAALDEGIAIAGAAPNSDGAALGVLRGELLLAVGDRDAATDVLLRAFDEGRAVKAPMLQLLAAVRLARLAGPADVTAMERLSGVRDAIAAGGGWDEAFEDFRAAGELLEAVPS